MIVRFFSSEIIFLANFIPMKIEQNIELNFSVKEMLLSTMHERTL